MKKIWILGSSNIDTTYVCHKLPGAGQTVLANSSETTTGGKGANQAFAAAHWGADVAYIGAVGDDDKGNKLLSVLISSGINIDNVYVTRGESGNAVIIVDKTGEDFIVVFPGANLHVPVDMDIAFKSGDILMTQLEINTDAIQAYFARAKSKGVTTILNPSPSKDISDDIYKNTDIIVANKSEAFCLGGIKVYDKQTAEKCAAEITKKGPKHIIITLGCMGAYVKSNQAWYFKGYKVKVFDSQGAGDAFLGSFAARMLIANDIYEAVEFANAVGALAVMKKGSTQFSMPQANEVDQLLKKSKPWTRENNGQSSIIL